jgi:hypothetical protein
MARRQGNKPDLQATALVATRQAEVTRWEEAHHTYRAHLETLALTLPPFRVADSASQLSAQVASQLQATVAAIDMFAQCYQLPAWHDAMTKVRKQVPALTAEAKIPSRTKPLQFLSVPP